MLTLFGVGTVRYTLQNSCPPFDRLSLVGMLTKCKQREKFILCPPTHTLVTSEEDANFNQNLIRCLNFVCKVPFPRSGSLAMDTSLCSKGGLIGVLWVP